VTCTIGIGLAWCCGLRHCQAVKRLTCSTRASVSPARDQPSSLRLSIRSLASSMPRPGRAGRTIEPFFGHAGFACKGCLATSTNDRRLDPIPAD
jgi:hypothetical protein